jgi:hypothetical protein
LRVHGEQSDGFSSAIARSPDDTCPDFLHRIPLLLFPSASVRQAVRGLCIWCRDTSQAVRGVLCRCGLLSHGGVLYHVCYDFEGLTLVGQRGDFLASGLG